MSDDAVEHPDVRDAQRDPRLAVSREAMIRDWSAAMKAAERTRRYYEWGLIRIVRHDRPEDGEEAHRAARARRAIAQAELDNELAEISAMTLVAMVSAVDALVQELVPAAREATMAIQIEEVFQKLTEERPQLLAQAEGREDDLRAIIRAGMDAAAQSILPELDSWPRDAGAKRWERVLKQVGLHARPDRQIPADLDEALREVVHLRHVIAHRASRVDRGALKKAPSLARRYAQDDLVRITRDDYRTYSAALWTYSEEILRRVLGSAGPPEIPLDQWRRNHSLNV